MISDFVKGRKKDNYPPGILAGISLHRLIDAFTDTHAATQEAKSVFRPAYRLYSGAFVDVAYDHFLATDPAVFSDQSLFTFSQQVYTMLSRHMEAMPPAFAAMFPYMQSQNWLYHYREITGTRNSFAGLVRRAAYLEESKTAGRLFEQHYDFLKSCYRSFWSDMRPYAQQQYLLLKAGAGL
ncbi:MAG TPA: ACP phosphodiesterase [Chitinophagaceae bacterium]|nr:ACP phosphodiesterase [Chitinophagaceae bacterium]